MTKHGWRQSAVLWGVAVLAGGLGLFAACSSPGGGGGGGPAATDEVDLGEADVTVPDTGLTMLRIDEEGGTGSATYYAEEDVAEGDAEMESFEAETTEGTMTGKQDDQGRPVEIALGSMVITFTHNEDGTVDYELTDDGEVVYDGAGLVADETIAKNAPRSHRGYSAANTKACTNTMMYDWAEDNDDANAGLPCVREDAEIIKTAMMLCIMKHVLIVRLYDAESLCQPKCAGLILEDECMNKCTGRMTRARDRLYTYYYLLWYASQDMAADIGRFYRENGYCPGEEPNDNANTNDNSNAADDGCDMSGEVDLVMLDARIDDRETFWVCEQKAKITNTHDSETVYIKFYLDEVAGIYNQVDSWDRDPVSLEPGETEEIAVSTTFDPLGSSTIQRMHYSKYIALRGEDCLRAVNGVNNTETYGQVDEDAAADLGVVQMAMPADGCPPRTIDD